MISLLICSVTVNLGVTGTSSLAENTTSFCKAAWAAVASFYLKTMLSNDLLTYKK
jgi:hypothetical protein